MSTVSRSAPNHQEPASALVSFIVPPYLSELGKSNAVIVCVPTRGSITAETVQALTNMHMAGIPGLILIRARDEVISARNHLALAARVYAEKNVLNGDYRYFVLWVDEDAWWTPEALTTMFQAFIDLNLTDRDILYGYSSIREPWTTLTNLSAFEGSDSAKLWKSRDVNSGRMLHFGLHDVALLSRLGSTPFSPREVEPGTFIGDDIAFCSAINKIAGRHVVLTSALVGYVEDATGQAFFPEMPVKRIHNNEICDSSVGEVLPRPNRRYGPVLERIHRYPKLSGTGENLLKHQYRFR